MLKMCQKVTKRNYTYLTTFGFFYVCIIVLSVLKCSSGSNVTHVSRNLNVIIFFFVKVAIPYFNILEILLPNQVEL